MAVAPLRKSTPPGVPNAPLRKATPPGTGNMPLTEATPPGVPNAPLRRATSDPSQLLQASSMNGGISGPSSTAGAVIDPGYRPPPPRPPVAPTRPTPPPIVPPRTFRPPQAPTRDPRIEELLRALTGEGNGGSNGPDPLAAQSAQLEALLSKLMKGEGIATPDLSNDPAAQAFALTKRREEERAREAEASALGASGVAGSGDFDGRVAQLREATGQSIAANNADLTNQRRGEALATAMSGAQLKLADLDRQTRARQADQAMKSGDRSALLSALLSREGGDADRYERALDRNMMREDHDLDYSRGIAEKRYDQEREDPLDALRRQLLEQDVETGKRTLNKDQGIGRYKGGRIIIPGYNDRYGPAPWQR